MDAAATILHVDMDAFFVSCELLRRPELRGLPVVVGGGSQRGVVAAASYEARAHGVHSAMPSGRARRLCPHAVFLDGDHVHYRGVSARLMEIFRSFTPLVEPLSLDEAFLDVSGARRLHGSPRRIAEAIRSQVLEQEGLSCSVGVASTKFLAKLATGEAKPRPSPTGPVSGRGVKVVAPGRELEFLHPLPVSALWGVGPATLAKLDRLGVSTVGDLAAMPTSAVVSSLGAASGRHLSNLARGIDPRPVEPERAPKSVGHEETFARDHRHRSTLDREAVKLADATARRLREHDLAGRSVTVKVRFGDFRTITRSITVAAPVRSGSVLARLAKALLDDVDTSPGVRLLGVSVSKLSNDGPQQLELGQSRDRSWDDADAAVDRIRARFGADAVGPAALAGTEGLAVKREGDQQWGPTR